LSLKKIVIFASGSGSSVENIILSFSKTPDTEVSKVYCNNPEAFVLQRIKKYNVDSLVFNLDELNNDIVLKDLNKVSPDLIVLAGFLKKIPQKIINTFKNKIINIHPSLLPKYGGKGMFGLNVHKSVIKNNESETGLTIHHVNTEYDKGSIIFQKTIKVDTDDANVLAKKVLIEEHKYYPEIIKKVLYD
jgi:phosphoribosylglycinamide formyltransferase-1